MGWPAGHWPAPAACRRRRRRRGEGGARAGGEEGGGVGSSLFGLLLEMVVLMEVEGDGGGGCGGCGGDWRLWGVREGGGGDDGVVRVVELVVVRENLEEIGGGR